MLPGSIWFCLYLYPSSNPTTENPGGSASALCTLLFLESIIYNLPGVGQIPSWLSSQIGCSSCQCCQWNRGWIQCTLWMEARENIFCLRTHIDHLKINHSERAGAWDEYKTLKYRKEKLICLNCKINSYTWGIFSKRRVFSLWFPRKAQWPELFFFSSFMFCPNLIHIQGLTTSCPTFFPHLLCPYNKFPQQKIYEV